MAQADLDKVTNELGLKAHALSAAPSVKTHPARAARVALLHALGSTQTEGWWRQAFDIYGIPYDYIDPQAVQNTPDLRAKYDVIIFGPGGSQQAVTGTPLWQSPIPYKNTPETPNIGTWAQTDDMRLGHGAAGPACTCRTSSPPAACSSAPTARAEFAINNNFTHGVTANTPGTATRVVGSLLRTKLVDTTSPIVYGIPDNLAMYSDSGETFSVNAGAAADGGGGGAAAAGAAGAGAAVARADRADRPRHARRSGRRPGRARSKARIDAAAAAGDRAAVADTRSRPTSS